MNEFVTNCTDDTMSVAYDLALTLKGGETLLLSGDLGAGKTVFAKGIAKGLGITDEVTSPTFALHNVYYGRLKLNHFDFYRIEDAEEIRIIGLDEYFGERDSVSVIEWWQNVSELLPKLCISISIDKLSDTSRRIRIEQNES